MAFFFFDTETSGKFNFNKPHTDASQPYIVQFAGILLDENLQHELFSLNTLVHNEGLSIPAEASAIHGITDQDCMKFGISPQVLAALIYDIVLLKPTLIAHNINFDRPVVATLLHRCGAPLEDISAFRNLSRRCTMLESTSICKIPARRGGYKWPKLCEAYKHFTGQEIQNAHDALADVRACIEIFKSLP